MPNVTLRLDEGLHAELVAAAAAGARSLQREIIGRLDGRIPVGLGAGEPGAGSLPVPAGGVAQQRLVTPRADAGPSSPAPSPGGRVFRGPDPKGGLGSGEVSRAGFSPVTAAASPVPNRCPGDVPAGTRCKLCGKKH